MMAVAPSLIELITDLFFREGYPFAEDERIYHELRLSWEWNSGQWVMLTGLHDELWGWLAWYRTSPEILELIHNDDLDDYVRSGNTARDLTSGPCMYVSTSVVVPYAPYGTYRRLFELACDVNRDAESVCAHLRKRNGSVRWLSRPQFKRNPPCLLEKTSPRANPNR